MCAYLKVLLIYLITFKVSNHCNTIEQSPTGTLTVEAIYQDRDQFAMLVRDMASPDVGRMGIEILSFTIKDVFDNVDYLESLGKTQTANVKRDADVGVALANTAAGIRVCRLLLEFFFNFEH